MIIKVKHWSFVKFLGVRRRSRNYSFGQFLVILKLTFNTLTTKQILKIAIDLNKI